MHLRRLIRGNLLETAFSVGNNSAREEEQQSFLPTEYTYAFLVGNDTDSRNYSMIFSQLMDFMLAHLPALHALMSAKRFRRLIVPFLAKCAELRVTKEEKRRQVHRQLALLIPEEEVNKVFGGGDSNNADNFHDEDNALTTTWLTE